MRANILKKIIESHLTADQDSFIRCFLQLAAQEEKAGHKKIAQELKSAIEQIRNSNEIDKQLKNNIPLNIYKPKENLSDLLSVSFSYERLCNVILSSLIQEKIAKILKENLRKDELSKWNVYPNRKLLFYGPPGCGKTLTAKAIAGELKLPLLTINFASLISKYLGSTANKLQLVFNEIASKPGVYLFDEFDAIGKHRNDEQEVGEIKRVVTSFLQMMDNDKSYSLIIAATNYETSLDYALFRRFDEVLEFKMPESEDLKKLLNLRLSLFNFPKNEIYSILEKESSEMSFADLARACDNSIKAMILDGRNELNEKDIIKSIEDVKKRFKGSKKV